MHIVHVDDDPEYRLLVEDILSGLGLPITQTETIADAWERIISTDRVMVLCDERLPEGSGMGLLRKIRNAGRPDFFVLLTGMASDKLRKDALAAGADEVIEKPLDILALERKLTALVGRSSRSAVQRIN